VIPTRNRIAVEKASRVVSEYGRDPFQIARSLGFRVFYADLPDGCEEMVLPDGRLMFLRPEAKGDLHRARRLVAHALGHHFLHTGNQVSGGSLPADWFHKHERQAEAFAATLLFGRAAGEAI
jgi:IrrE N-terminal-like domain